jgi:hypothetical protein
MPGKYLRGAFVEFMPTFLVPLPNVIIFQYNPETITHTWTPAAAGGGGAATTGAGGSGVTNPLAVKGVPGETFSFSLALDAADMIIDEGPIGEGLAVASGVYTRLAALEMLQYPTGSFSGSGLLGTVSSALGGGPSGDREVPESQVPTVLFIWGPGRILPVRVTGLTITEKLYDSTLLNPTHADVQVGLKVLTPEELEFVNGPLKDIAKAAYVYSQGLRQALALANLGNAVDSIIGMLPV